MAFNDENLCIFIGRLTRDPEIKTFQGSGKLASFSLAFTGENKKGQDGKWEDVPCFLECKVWNSEKGRKLADVVEQYLKKGSHVYVKGALTLEKWQDKNSGDNRQAHKLRVLEIKLLDKKGENSGGGGGGSQSRSSSPPPARQDTPQNETPYTDGPDDDGIPW